MANSKAKLKSNGDKASPYFKPFLIGNMSHLLAYLDSAIGFIQTQFYKPYQFHWDTKLNLYQACQRKRATENHVKVDTTHNYEHLNQQICAFR